ncbi:MAG: twin-arginine translocation signal domain-containing protein, partial [Nitrospira sp.]
MVKRSMATREVTGMSHISRRRFLQLSAMTGGALAVSDLASRMFGLAGSGSRAYAG